MPAFNLITLIRHWIRTLPAAAPAQTPTLVHLEAEDASLRGELSRLTDTPGHAGNSYVGNFENTTDTLTFSVPTPASRYRLTIRYTSPSLGVDGNVAPRTLLTTGPSPPPATPSVLLMPACSRWRPAPTKSVSPPGRATTPSTTSSSRRPRWRYRPSPPNNSLTRWLPPRPRR